MARPFTLLKNGMLIDGTGQAPLEEAGVLIQGSTIVNAGRMDELDVPSEGRLHTIDVSGKTIMPGMIDCHVHLWFHLQRSMYDNEFRSPEMNAILAARNAKTYLESGFTSIRDVGTQGTISIAVRDAIEQGLIPGPRVKAYGRVISTTGGLGDRWPSWIDATKSSDTILVNGVNEAMKAARGMIKEGADGVKLDASGTSMSPFCPSSRRTLTLEELAAASMEAHKNGKLVAIHAENTESIKAAIKAGANTIEHGIGLDDEAIRMMKEMGVFLVPTLGNYQIRYEAGPRVTPQYALERFRELLDVHVKSFRKAYEKGVRIALGTDAGGSHYPHGSNAKDLEFNVKFGMSEMDALVSATKNAADAIGLGNQIGTITKGKLADVIVIDGNPLKDIKILQNKKRISKILKNGEIIKK
jgi:imidazolonepropionase-like amidohydrolase